MELLVFHTLVIAHILTGTVGAVAFWVPVLGRKGSVNHRKWGQVFTLALLCTGWFAVGMSVLSLIDPMGTHPQLVGRFDESFVRGLFGHLMLHTAILTVNLAWYGWLVVRHRGNQALNRTPFNLALQWLVIAAALNCAVQGWLIDQPLMMGIAIVGVATGWTNLHFLAKPHPDPVIAAHKATGSGRFVFIGDSTYDVRAAKAAGVPVIAAAYGYCDKPPHELGADTVIDSFADLIPALSALRPAD